jgi:hypothetical protein
LSTAAAILAVVPLVTTAVALAVDDVLDRAGVLGHMASWLYQLSLLCVPAALPLGIAAIYRLAGEPARPGIGLALAATVLAAAELFLLFLAAYAPA